jgi:hypothetical protein
MHAMGNPVPPAGLCPVFCEPSELSSDNRSGIAAALGLPDLPPLWVETIEAVIAVNKMQSGLPTVTVGENLAAIHEALDKEKRSALSRTPATAGLAGRQ